MIFVKKKLFYNFSSRCISTFFLFSRSNIFVSFHFFRRVRLFFTMFEIWLRLNFNTLDIFDTNEPKTWRFYHLSTSLIHLDKKAEKLTFVGTLILQKHYWLKIILKLLFHILTFSDRQKKRESFFFVLSIFFKQQQKLFNVNTKKERDVVDMIKTQ